MKKFFDKIRKNNKGFTLVEMIIVIAVMAILTVVVAPQYIKYVEKSRVGTDENALGELQHIVEISYVEVAAADKTGTPDNTVVVKIDANTGKISYDPASGDVLTDVVSKVYPAGTSTTDGAYIFKSTEYKGDIITFTVNKDTGIAARS